MINRLAVVIVAVLMAAMIVPGKADAQATCRLTVEISGSGVDNETVRAMETSLITALRGRGARVYESGCKQLRANLSVAARAEGDTAKSLSLPIPPVKITMSDGTVKELDIFGYLTGSSGQAATIDKLRLDAKLVVADGEYIFTGWVEALRATQVAKSTTLDIFTNIGGKTSQSQMSVRVETPSQLLDTMAISLVERIPIQYLKSY